MGFRDDLRNIREDQQGLALLEDVTPEGCVGPHYVTEVNKGSINMTGWQIHLNEMHRKGYRLAHVLQQSGNTVQVFEHFRH